MDEEVDEQADCWGVNSHDDDNVYDDYGDHDDDDDNDNNDNNDDDDDESDDKQAGIVEVSIPTGHRASTN